MMNFTIRNIVLTRELKQQYYAALVQYLPKRNQRRKKTALTDKPKEL